MTRRAAGALVVALVCFSVVWTSCGQRREAPAPFLRVLLEHHGDSVSVIRSDTLHTVSPRNLPGDPRLTLQGWRAAGTGDDELLLSVHDAKGKTLDVHGFSSPHGFGEEIRAGTNGLSGGFQTPKRAFHLLYVPVPPEARHLALHTAEVRSGSYPTAVDAHGGRHLAVSHLGAIALDADASPRAELDHPVRLDDAAVDLPVIHATGDTSSDRSIAEPDTSRGGELQGKKTLAAPGPPSKEFDIVILGDGFGFGEVAEFDKKAKLFTDYFLSYPPFDSLRAHINVYVVLAMSVDSGITDCTNESLHKTYFGIQGDFQRTPGDSTYPAFCGTHDPQVVYDAAATAVANEETDLYFVIANCVEYQGGSAFPPIRMAFATMGSCEQEFLDIAVHECAHVIAGLADEYLAGAPDDGTVFPNMARQADVDSGRVAWKGLARPDELDASGGFAYVHLCGGAFDPVRTCETGNPCPNLCDADCTPGMPCAPCDPVIPGGEGYPQDADKLGLFWGCQFIDPAQVNDPPRYDCGIEDERGCAYYRGSPRCKMRFEDYPFCRVCADALERAILRRS